MPGKIFGLDLRLPTTQSDKNTTNGKSSKRSSEADLRHPNMDHVKRPSIASLAKKHVSGDKKDKDRSLSKDKHAKDQRAVSKPKPVTMSMVMESPPALLIGVPEQSSGALISGRLQVTPHSSQVILEDITMYLEATTTMKRPVHDRCRECMTNVSDLFEWKFLSKPKVFSPLDGTQELPFSHLVPGHLPATTHGHLAALDYSLHVRAKASDGQEIEFRRELIVQRALIPGPDKSSIRVFPPTNLTLHVILPNIVHPIGEFPVQCRMTGIVSKRDDSQTRWRLRKLTWRIEEKEIMVSPACAKHAGKLGGEGKGIQHEHTRDLAIDELKSGWKTDFDDNQVEGEFNAAIDSSTKPQCSMEAQNGLKITHSLVLELVIAEEWAPNKKPMQATPTGAARVLRTQFNLNVTERAGMGISWDDESPPTYEDVPASPPHYGGSALTRIENYDGSDLHDDVEHLSLN